MQKGPSLARRRPLYADSKDVRDLGQPYDIVESYRYRDWVVRALNQDLPYDEFVRYQIAGDLLPAANPDEVNVDAITATGLLTFGSWGAGDADVQKMYTDMVDDQINVVSRAFLGLTVSCARCHDHKFDPIPTADYYGLAGIFFSARIAIPQISAPYNQVPLVPKAQIDRFNQAVAGIKAKQEEIKNFVDAQYAAPARAIRCRHRSLFVGGLRLSTSDGRKLEADGGGNSAATAQLRGDALGQWIEYLNFFDDQRMLNRALPNIDGKAGIFGWRAEADLPVVVLNTGKETVRIPAVLRGRSLGIHPGPNSGVGVVWTSPFTGTVGISGRVAHAHPECGNGVAWAMQKVSGGNVAVLSRGTLPQGGKQPFSTLTEAEQLTGLPVVAGDSVLVMVFPNGHLSCDMVALDLEIAERGGEGRLWNLAEDLLAAVPGGGGQSGRRPRLSGQPSVLVAG